MQYHPDYVSFINIITFFLQYLLVAAKALWLSLGTHCTHGLGFFNIYLSFIFLNIHKQNYGNKSKKNVIYLFLVFFNFDE